MKNIILKVLIFALLFNCSPLLFSNDDNQFPGSESFPQQDGVKHKKEPEFPGSESYTNPPNEYPKEILPSTPTNVGSLGKHFVNTLGVSTPNSYPGSDSYDDDKSYQQAKVQEDYPTFGPHENEFPDSDTYSNDKTYKPYIKPEQIRVNAGGYSEPKQYYEIIEPHKKQHVNKPQNNAIDNKGYYKMIDDNTSNNTYRNKGEI